MACIKKKLYLAWSFRLFRLALGISTRIPNFMFDTAIMGLKGEKEETKSFTAITHCSYLVHRFRHWTLHREPTLSSQILHLTLWHIPEQREKKKPWLWEWLCRKWSQASKVSLCPSPFHYIFLHAHHHWPEGAFLSPRCWGLPSATLSFGRSPKLLLNPHRCVGFSSQVGLLSISTSRGHHGFPRQPWGMQWTVMAGSGAMDSYDNPCWKGLGRAGRCHRTPTRLLCLRVKAGSQSQGLPHCKTI